jgi:hypothetical protein
MIYSALFLVILIVVADVLTGLGRSIFIGQWTFVRLTICALVCFVFLVVPLDSRVHFGFRNCPGFLEFYEANKGIHDFYR